MSQLAVTWWGHSSLSVELGGTTVATDPLLTERLYHLMRLTPAPEAAATRADVVLISHLHYDHLHLPSLDRFDRDVPVVVPKGAPREVPGLTRRRLLEVVPGDRVTVAGVEVEVIAARHDGRRNVVGRDRGVPAIGFRFAADGRSCWYPGDTGLSDFAAVEPVDLACVPIGGWGPTLGADHLHPGQAATAAAEVGARWALAVHYGTYWPWAMRRLHPRNHHRLFVTPPQRFLAALADGPVRPLVPAQGARQVLD